MTRSAVNVVWASGNDAYHMDRARSCFPENEYFDALAREIQQDRPDLTYRDALREATVIDDYCVQVLAGKKLGKRTHERLKSQTRIAPITSLPAVSFDA